MTRNEIRDYMCGRCQSTTCNSCTINLQLLKYIMEEELANDNERELVISSGSNNSQPPIGLRRKEDQDLLLKGILDKMAEDENLRHSNDDYYVNMSHNFISLLAEKFNASEGKIYDVLKVYYKIFEFKDEVGNVAARSNLVDNLRDLYENFDSRVYATKELKEKAAKEGAKKKVDKLPPIKKPLKVKPVISHKPVKGEKNKLQDVVEQSNATYYEIMEAIDRVCKKYSIDKGKNYQLTYILPLISAHSIASKEFIDIINEYTDARNELKKGNKPLPDNPKQKENWEKMRDANQKYGILRRSPISDTATKLLLTNYGINIENEFAQYDIPKSARGKKILCISYFDQLTEKYLKCLEVAYKSQDIVIK